MKAHDYQLYGINESDRILEQEAITRLLLSSPTGGGKTFMAGQLIERWVDRGYGVGLYTNRRYMVDQLSRDLDEAGIEHGIRAAKKKINSDLPVQICMIQSEQSAARKAKENMAEYALHNCRRVIVDEAHLNAGDGMRGIMAQHEKEGAKILGLSATPLDLEGVYQKLIQAGTNSQLRDAGMLIPAIHFAPDEPDVRAFKRLKKKLANIESDTWHPTEGQVVDLYPLKPALIGRVWHWFEKLNPEHEPAILFAPSVAGSAWFAQQFEKMGVRAAHIAADGIWLDGGPHRATDRLKEQIRKESENGKIPIVCNRFVMREGTNWPWLKHGVLATIFGSLTTYLQAMGRLLRGHHSMRNVTIQDHGGNWWRWGSCNSDRYWHIEDTDELLQMKRADRLRRKGPKDPTEPFVCPQCACVLMAGCCTNCGWAPGLWIKSRPVVSTDGTLRLMTGDIFRPRFIFQGASGPERWERIFWASRKNAPDRTFRQASVLFAKDNNWQWPNPEWPLMPKRDDDWYMPISLVDFADLYPKLQGEPDGTKSQKYEGGRQLPFDEIQLDSDEHEWVEADRSPWDEADG